MKVCCICHNNISSIFIHINKFSFLAAFRDTSLDHQRSSTTFSTFPKKEFDAGGNNQSISFR